MAQSGRAGATGGPPGTGGIVSRRKLLERLEGAARVALVSAPAGSGKTMLLRAWIREAGLAESAAWVSLQDRAPDPQRFWISVLDALRQTVAGSALVQGMTAAPNIDGWAVVERLLHDLGSLDGRIWLVIDDLHELRSSEALRQLELLLQRSPPRLRFVLATRRDLRLGLHRLRLEGGLTEIRAADLRFSLDEARTLFRAAGVELPDPTLVLLVDRTEGWAAGLRLAALSLAGRSDPECFAVEFSGTERTVAEYLLAEVLERQPEHVRRLLLRTSILERVNGTLADHLTGDAGGERILLELEGASAFVVSLDPQRSWFRYHHLFADLLRLELRRTASGELPALHGAAAEWYAEHGHPIEAIRHAQAAERWDLAARLLFDRWPGLALSGQAATAHELLSRFPVPALTSDPELTALRAADELNRGSLDETERLLALAAERLGSIPGERLAHVEAALAILRLYVARQRGDLPAVLEETRRLLAPAGAPDAALLGLGEDLRALALVSLGIAEVWALRVTEAERHLEQGVGLARRIGQPYLEISGLAHLAQLASGRSYSQTAVHGRQAIELAREHGWSEEPVVAVAYLALGAAMVWQGRLEDAERSLERAGRTLPTRAEPASAIMLQGARGALELARGRDADALAAFEEGERLAELLVSGHSLGRRTRAVRLHTLARVGETARADRALAEMDEEERSTGEMRTALAAVRLAQDEPEAASAVLAPILDDSPSPVHPLWRVTAFLLDAIARDALGDLSGADRALERALDLAELDGALWPFLLHPAPGLLERHRRRRTSHGALVAEVLSLLGGREPASPRDERERPRESLSEGETRVLRYLPTNLSVPEIADELYLSVNTVKTHMRHVYAKLGAQRRRQAVERARALGLLAPSPRGL